MNNNAFYNMVALLHVLQKNLYQIDEYYLPQATNEEERVFYRNLKMDTENHIKELTQLLGEHIK